MMPVPYWHLARLHEERIRAAQAPRPEWMYEAALAARPRQGSGAAQQFRVLIAQALRRLAARVEPRGSTWQPAGSGHPASAQ